MWLDFLLSGRPMAAPLKQLNYADYAQAEAAMGWLNARGVVRLPAPQAAAELARPLIKALQAELARQNAAIGNLKLELIADDGAVRSGVTNVTAEPDLAGPTVVADRFDLVLNVRATVGPEALAQAVNQALDQTLRHPSGTTAVLTYLNAFSPAPPRPTFRGAN
jgi:hypothetical protein